MTLLKHIFAELRLPSNKLVGRALHAMADASHASLMAGHGDDDPSYLVDWDREHDWLLAYQDAIPHTRERMHGRSCEYCS